MSALSLAALLAGASAALSVDAASLATPIALPARVGDRVVIEGSFHSTIDGSDVDGAHLRDTYPGRRDADLRPVGLIDWEAGGLQIVERDWNHHRAVAVVIADRTSACSTASIAGPCIVPRVDVLAHERLVPRAAYLLSLRGGLNVTTTRPAVVASWMPAMGTASMVCVCVLVALWAFVGFRRRNQAWRKIAREGRLLAKDARNLPNGAVVRKRLSEVTDVAKRTARLLARVNDEAEGATGKVRVSLEAKRQTLAADLQKTAEKLASLRLRLALGGDGDQVDAALGALCAEVDIGETALAETSACSLPLRPREQDVSG